MGGQMQVAFSILHDMYQTQERELKLKCGDSEIVQVSKKAWIKRCMSANVWTGKQNNVVRGINTMIEKSMLFLAHCLAASIRLK